MKNKKIIILIAIFLILLTCGIIKIFRGRDSRETQYKGETAGETSESTNMESGRYIVNNVDMSVYGLTKMDESMAAEDIAGETERTESDYGKEETVTETTEDMGITEDVEE